MGQEGLGPRQPPGAHQPTLLWLPEAFRALPPSLLMECQPPAPPLAWRPGPPDASPAVLSCVLQACAATMFQCVHFWGWKALESSVDHSDAAAPKEMTSFQMTLCSVLVRKLRQGTAPGARGFIL